MTDYNDREWHIWKGGDCPVHPESVVEVRMRDVCNPEDGSEFAARTFRWTHDDEYPVGAEIVCFRVVKPYVEPETRTGECWAYHYKSSAPGLADHNAGNNCTHGRYTVTLANGKPTRIVWEAGE